MDLDKAQSRIFVNYYLEDFKILVKVPMKKKEDKEDNNIIIDKFDISNKIYLTQII
jgi:hypothetical protein